MSRASRPQRPCPPVRSMRPRRASVRRIFAAYAAGRSPRRIAGSAESGGHCCTRWAVLGASTINGNPARGTGILNNELYVGRLIRNRLRYIRNPATGRRVSRLNDPSQWLVRDVPEPRIVELWDRVKARQQAMHRDTRPDARAIRPFRDRSRPRFLLAALIKCGQCGAGHTKTSANLFSCAAARNKRTAAPQDRRCDRRRRSGVHARGRTTLAARTGRLWSNEGGCGGLQPPTVRHSSDPCLSLAERWLRGCHSGIGLPRPSRFAGGVAD
jgi:hypothetical protein